MYIVKQNKFEIIFFAKSYDILIHNSTQFCGIKILSN